MWIEVIDQKTNRVDGAVNSDCCNAIKIDPNGTPETGALICEIGTGTEKIYKTRQSYLAIVCELTGQTKAKLLEQDRFEPKIVSL